MARKAKKQADNLQTPVEASTPAPELPPVADPQADAPDAAKLKAAPAPMTAPVAVPAAPTPASAPIIRIAIGIPAALAANIQIVAGDDETVGAVLVRLGELFWRHYPVLRSRPNGKAIVLADTDLDRVAAVMARTPDYGSEVADVLEALASYNVGGHMLPLDIDTIDQIAAHDPSGTGKLTAEDLLPRIVMGGIRLFLQGDLDITSDGLPFDIPADPDLDPDEAGG